MLALAIAWLALTGTPVYGDTAFKIIVHPDNPAAVLDRSFLRAAFLKQSVRWPHGEPIRPLDVRDPGWLHDRFSEDVLQRSPMQLRGFWTQRIFSGTGLPPPEVSSSQEAIVYVLANRGAVSYLPADTDPQGAKVVKLR